MALALAACSTTVSKDESFSAGAPGQAYVLVVTDTSLREGGRETFDFHRVDLPSSTFVPRQWVSVWFAESTMTTARANEFRKPQPLAQTPLRFGGRKLAAGEYALTMVGSRSSAIAFSNCYSKGAPIYRFREGTINIVRLGRPADIASSLSGAAVPVDVRDPAALDAQVAQVLAGYPNMAAPRALATPIGYARFDPGQTWMGEPACSTSDGFTFYLTP